MTKTSIRYAIRRMLLEADGVDQDVIKNARSYYMRFIPARGDKQMTMAATIALALGDERKFIDRLAASFSESAAVAAAAKGSWGSSIDVDKAREYITSLKAPMTNIGREELFSSLLRTFEGSISGVPIRNFSLSAEEQAILDAWNSQSSSGSKREIPSGSEESVLGGAGEGIGTTGTGSEAGIQDVDPNRSSGVDGSSEASGRELTELDRWAISCADVLNEAVIQAVQNLRGKSAANIMKIEIYVQPDGSIRGVLIRGTSGRPTVDDAVKAAISPLKLPVPPEIFNKRVKADRNYCIEFSPDVKAS